MTNQNLLEPSLSEKFEKERYSRILEEEKDPKVLKEIAKNFLELWMQQKAAARWAIMESAKSLTPLPQSLETVHKEVSQWQHDSDQQDWEEDLTG